MTLATTIDGTLRATDVLRRTLDSFRRNGIAFMLLDAVGGLPTLAAQILDGQTAGLLRSSTTPGGAGPWAMALIFIGIGVELLAQATIFYAAFEDFRGRPIDIAAALQAGSRRLLPLFFAGLVWFLSILLGLVLLVVPGFYLLAAGIASQPVCVVEGRGPVASLRRSLELTRGRRWLILGIVLVGMLGWGIGLGLVEALQPVLTDLLGRWSFVVIEYVANVAVGVLFILLETALYHDLRVLLDGSSGEEFVAVFD